MSSLSEYEREIIRERVDYGRKRYISMGGRMGPPVKEVPWVDIQRLLSEGVPKVRVAKKYKISVSTIYNRIKENEKK